MTSTFFASCTALLLLAGVGSLGAAQAAAEDLATADAGWCLLSAPKTAKPGDKVTLHITVKPGFLPQATRLNVDLHQFIGKERKPGAGRARPVALHANEGSEHAPTFTIPAEANAVAFVVYAMPEGKSAWSDRIEDASLGIKVVP